MPMIASPAAENCKRQQVAGSLILSLRSLGAGAANAQRSRFEAALARFAASSGNKALRRSVFARHGVAEGVERRRRGRVNFRQTFERATGLTSSRKIPRRPGARHNA